MPSLGWSTASPARSPASPLPLALLFLALLPRLLGAGEATTIDEDEWMSRSAVFTRSLSTGDWGRTYQSGHPGVIPMWLTNLTLGQSRARGLLDDAPVARIGQSREFLPALYAARPVFAILSALLAVSCGLL